ncbi:hypothetical protein EGA29_19870 [Ralstonia pseudosolanacearum]|uniref:Uncharacterized protein n=1 Tax=Ralstonia pseudosolanacearum TaxID=1310165 RepID=A0A454TLN9_9RALS|nr:hypothetical protein EGA29_19870 [Ralstonia pseudosolanacearum]
MTRATCRHLIERSELVLAHVPKGGLFLCAEEVIGLARWLAEHEALCGATVAQFSAVDVFTALR